jgi:cathepsin L
LRDQVTSIFVALFACAWLVIIGNNEDKKFLAHLREFDLSYSGEEYQFRLGLFLGSLRWVEEHNASVLGFQLGLNQLLTWTPSEYRQLLGHIASDDVTDVPVLPMARAIQAPPATYNWKDHGKVQEVKNQGKCGSCWTFRAIGAQESQSAINTGKLVSLSEQNLLDCVTQSKGCNSNVAYQYVKSKQASPYEAKQGSCRYKAAGAITKLSGYGTLASRDETSLQNAIYTYGPASIAIDANHDSFQKYKSGVYNEPVCSSTRLDHKVLAIGWGTNPSPYWLIKNSWGTFWGDEEFIRITRGKNQCRVATDVVIPLPELNQQANQMNNGRSIGISSREECHRESDSGIRFCEGCPQIRITKRCTVS